MKKFLFFLCAAAMLATMYSCCCEPTGNPVLSPVIIDNSRILVVTTNTPSDITYDGKTVTNATTATFNDAAANGKLVINPKSGQYYGQESSVAFNDRNTLYMDVQLVKKPTITVSQADAKNGAQLTNDDENRTLSGADATLIIPANLVITGNTTDPFSITVYEPAGVELESVGVGKELKADVLGIRCTPDGAKFSEPVTVLLGMENSSGYDISCVYEDNRSETSPFTDLGNDKWQARFSHFSDWFNVMRCVVTEISRGEEVYSNSSLVAFGKNTITFPYKAGAKELTTTKCRLVTTFIKKKFGSYLEIAKNASFTSSEPGSAFWSVTQPYTDVTLTSRLKVFKVRIYGEPKFEFTKITGDDSGHSGGSIG